MMMIITHIYMAESASASAKSISISLKRRSDQISSTPKINWTKVRTQQSIQWTFRGEFLSSLQSNHRMVEWPALRAAKCESCKSRSSNFELSDDEHTDSSGSRQLTANCAIDRRRRREIESGCSKLSWLLWLLCKTRATLCCVHRKQREHKNTKAAGQMKQNGEHLHVGFRFYSKFNVFLVGHLKFSNFESRKLDPWSCKFEFRAAEQQQTNPRASSSFINSPSRDSELTIRVEWSRLFEGIKSRSSEWYRVSRQIINYKNNIHYSWLQLHHHHHQHNHE